MWKTVACIDFHFNRDLGKKKLNAYWQLHWYTIFVPVSRMLLKNVYMEHENRKYLYLKNHANQKFVGGKSPQGASNLNDY